MLVGPDPSLGVGGNGGQISAYEEMCTGGDGGRIGAYGETCAGRDGGRIGAYRETCTGAHYSSDWLMAFATLL